jgi:hypothetical protein
MIAEPEQARPSPAQSRLLPSEHALKRHNCTGARFYRSAAELSLLCSSMGFLTAFGTLSPPLHPNPDASAARTPGTGHG